MTGSDPRPAGARRLPRPKCRATSMGWHPAVVLELGEASARIGIEGVDEDADGHCIAAEDVSWARKRQARRPARPEGEGGRRSGRGRRCGAGARRDRRGRQLRALVAASGARDPGRLHGDGRQHRPRASPCRAASPTSPRSSTAPPRRSASRARRSSPSSMRPPSTSGFSPATIVVDAPIEVDTPQGIWRPKNASNKFYGPTPMRTGIEQSRNLMTVRIAQEVGMDTVARYAERFGVYDRHAAVSGQCARRAGNHALQDGRGLCDVRQWRRAGRADAGRPGAGPLGPHRLSPRPARLRRLPAGQPRSRASRRASPRTASG